MEAHPRSPEIQGDGCWALALLSLGRRSGYDAVLAAGGVIAVQRAMLYHGSCGKVQEHGCFAFSRLLSHTSFPGLCGPVGYTCIGCVVDAMRSHPLIEAVQEYGCAIFRNVSSCEQGRAAVKGRGGIDAIVGAMRENMQRSSMRVVACQALCHVARTDKIRMEVGDMGGVEMILAAIAYDTGCEGVCVNGCNALQTVALLEVNRRSIVRLGGVELVLRVMAQHTASTCVQLHGCMVLGNLARASCPASRDRLCMMQDAGIRAVLQAMQRHPFHLGLQRHACTAIHNLGCFLEGGDDTTVVEAVLQAMETHASDVELQLPACAVIEKLACRMMQDITVDLRQRISTTVVAAMQAHLRHVQFSEIGCRLFRTLVCYSHAHNQIMAACGVEVIVAAMREHIEVRDVQKDGFDVLGRLSKTRGHMTTVVQKGGLVAVMAGMRAHIADANTLFRGLCCLQDFMLHVENRLAVIDAGGADLVLEVLSHSENPSVRSVGRVFLEMCQPDYIEPWFRRD
ncbi:armadillo-type protein [Baffinella frigidus]|nr:armadillo-type protein [Cryptophyta sp. CCMP2293]